MILYCDRIVFYFYFIHLKHTSRLPNDFILKCITLLFYFILFHLSLLNILEGTIFIQKYSDPEVFKCIYTVYLLIIIR